MHRIEYLMAARQSKPPQIQPYRLSEFFQQTYVVPAYQRNYSWGTAEIDLFMDDLLEFFDDTSAPYYLLGDVIVVDSSTEYDLELIDGQQRVSTLAILFTCLYRRLSALDWDSDDLGELKTFIYKKHKLKIKMSGSASDSVQQYLNGSEVDVLPKSTPSQIAVIEAIARINEKLTEKFGSSKAGSIHDFVETLQESVYLSRLSLIDADSAFEFFERVNDRGRPLSKTDLLKNRLLQNITSDDDFENASDTWTTAEKKLMAFGREGTMNFLLRQMITADLGIKVKDSELFSKWKTKLKTPSECIDLVSRIDVGAEHLSRILNGQTPTGKPDLNSAGTRFMKFSQNIGLKLAGGKLSDATYDALSKRVETRAILSLFALERSQNYENLVTGWSAKVSKLSADNSVADVNDAIDISSSELKDLLVRAKLGIEALRHGKTAGQTNRIRLFLAIVNYELHLRSQVQHYEMKDLLTTSKKSGANQHPGYDIEHVGASSISANLGELVDSVGNLALFHSSDNRSAGATEVQFKASEYSASICYATKSLSKLPDADHKIEGVIASYRGATVDSGVWGIKEVGNRFDIYWSIFCDYIDRNLQPTTP